MPELNSPAIASKYQVPCNHPEVEVCPHWKCKWDERIRAMRHFCGKCMICRQQRCSCGGEKGEHVTVTISVDDDLCKSYFPGICVNGRWYRGPHQRVPKSMADWLQAAAKRWEKDEVDTRHGKTRRLGLGNIAGGGQ